MVVAFTGHRPKKLAGYQNRERYIMFVKKLRNILVSYIEKGADEFRTGGAQGMDQLAFWAVEGLKQQGYDIKNNIYIPFKGQELRWNETGIFSQKEYNQMIKCADEIIYLQEKPHTKANATVALMNRNHAMCNNADILIALYTGNDYHTDKGGTAECIRYAESINLPIHIISF